jgi:hypothetical protein
MRNVLCVRYGTCLGLAARRNRNFDCGRCRHRRSLPDDFNRHFDLWHSLDGCRLMLAAIFYPELYEAFNRLRSGPTCGAGAAAAEEAENGAGVDKDRGEIVEPGASP